MLAALAILAPVLHAQYFGQNKVRYHTLDWKVLKTEHFDVYYYDQERGAVDELGRMAERWYTRLSKLLNHQLSSRQPIILYASHTDFSGTTALPGEIGETTGGVTEGIRRRLIMPFAGPMAETDHVLGHELTHAFQYDIGSRPGQLQTGNYGALERLPLWFIEGMAEYCSIGPVDPHTAMWLRDAVRREAIPDIKKLEDPRYFPYRFGQAFWAFVAGRHGDQVVGEMLRAGARSGNPEAAISNVLHTTSAALFKDWRQALLDEYEPVLKLTRRPQDQARTLLANEKEGSDLTVSPIVSPDGKLMVYFSSRELFSIDLYLADASSARIIDKITDTATDPHFDSLQFVNSEGAWSRDSTQFAFPAVGKGRAELDIYDVKSRKITRKIQFPELAEVMAPTWSPDGKSIAFAAMRDGVTDLYIADLASGQPRRLTNDMYTELQPAWSPDGRTIAFVTDRFTSDVNTLKFGEYRLALLDVATGRIERGPGFDTGKHINPQWGPDPGSLYFVSDRDGISNIYRADGGRITQVTNVQSGVSGIASLSPAFSVSESDGRLLFSAFTGGNYSLYSIEDRTRLAGGELNTALAQLTPAVLPPRDRTGTVVARFLEQPTVGLRPATNFQRTDYHPHLSLEMVAQPQIGVGVSSFGSGISGGTAFLWSDLLGQHTLITSIQTNTVSDGSKFFNSLGGQVGYINQKSRWNWGFFGGQTPFLTGQLAQGLAQINGETVLVEQETRFWEISRNLTSIFAYPFSRAQRVEFSAGFQNLSYAADTTTRVFSPITGEFLGETQPQSIPTPDPLYFGTGSAALVYDTAIFGGTSPVRGQRYRFEVGGNAGSLKFGTLLMDYRRYVQFLRPLTLAGRVLHYGRYFGDDRDPRLFDNFLGYPTLVRGYDPNSFTASECGPNVETTGQCPVFDQLFGSRIAVGNVELRIPILGALGLIPSRNVPPVEIAPFYDAGIAWSRANVNRLADIARKPITSYGASLRVNLLGFAVGQISYVHPDDRPAKSWRWEFTLAPGF